MRTTVRAIFGERSSRCSRVVFPLPRNPVMTLTGIGLLAEVDDSESTSFARGPRSVSDRVGPARAYAAVQLRATRPPRSPALPSDQSPQTEDRRCLASRRV